MPILIRADFDASQQRTFARKTKDAVQARRLLVLGAAYEGATRSEAAKIGGVTRQIVRDWVLKFNAYGPDGLIDRKAPGQPSRLSNTHRTALTAVIENGPMPTVHGVVRWRLVDLCQWLQSGRYRYYTCAGCAQKGPTVCSGRSIGMAALDGMVLEHLSANLFQTGRLVQTHRRLTEAEGGASRLAQMGERELMDLGDPALKNGLLAVQQARGAAADEVRLLEPSASAGTMRITPEKIARFANLLCETHTSPDLAFRKALLRLFVGSIVVGDTEIRGPGPRAALAKAATLDELPPAAAVVPRFVREWRPRRDSNPRPQD